MDNQHIIKIKKEDFLEYLKYLNIIFKDSSNFIVLNNINECILYEKDYIPSIDYYDELIEDFINLILKNDENSSYNNGIINYNNISKWKAYIRLYKIKKII